MIADLSHDLHDRVLDAAIAVFAERGLRRGTLGEVARRAGVSRATLYRLFPGGKEALLASITLREARALFVLLEETLGSEEDPRTLLERGLDTSLRFLRSHPLLRRVLASEPEAILPYLTVRGAPVLQAAIDFAAPYVERAVKAGRIDPVPPRVAAEWLARMVLSLLLQPSVTVDLDDPAQRREFVAFLTPQAHEEEDDGAEGTT